MIALDRTRLIAGSYFLDYLCIYIQKNQLLIENMFCAAREYALAAQIRDQDQAKWGPVAVYRPISEPVSRKQC